MRGAWVVLSCVVACMVACGDIGVRGSESTSRGEQARVGGAVVSTVDGSPITVAQVQDLVRGSRLTPTEALRRLQAERLLMDEADRRGLRDARDARHVSRRAMAQALLDDEAARASVSNQELRDAYEKQHDRFHVPEKRASLHVLAYVESPEQDQAAYAFIRRVRDELAAAPVPEAAWARYRGHAEPGLKLSVDRIPPRARDGSLVAPYMEALFGVDGPSVVAQPVRTQFGWHAIVVTEIVPAYVRTLEEASAEVLRDELLRDKRQARIEELLRELGRGVPTQVAPDAPAQVAGLEL